MLEGRRKEGAETTRRHTRNTFAFFVKEKASVFWMPLGSPGGSFRLTPHFFFWRPLGTGGSTGARTLQEQLRKESGDWSGSTLGRPQEGLWKASGRPLEGLWKLLEQICPEF